MAKDRTAAPKKEKPVSTGSIAFRIALRSALNLIICFLIVDLLALGLLTFRQITPGADTFDTLRLFVSGFTELLTERKYDLLFQVEGIIVVIRLIMDYLRIRSQLKPIDDMAQAAMRLSEIDLDFDERFHKLESAIDEISPASEDARLSTGDAELEGLETAVNKLILRMRESYRQQARFVSDASHELRTPIAVIRGYADMLDRWGKDDEKVLRESIDAIRAESESMQHLVEQLLFLARGDSGRIPLDVKEFSLSDMMKEVCEESEMIDNAHEYRFEDEGRVTAQGDVALLKQTARILTENAVKYTPEGGEIVLRAFRKDGLPAFSVQDSGIGINEEDLPHVFERFYRADESRSKQTGGTGLGLAIAKWIVDRHGAAFDVISRKDIGTRIAVILK